ncbi:hypothetical protein PanWU01x14_047580 [Parasponia andersonii]|uniref:Transmembrane protein n=1 Tax=Parasponia andersonii TaxID=3476 RepID=A0A2P5DN24_PARAD|nr:hypothetical protein PanWU01x14_047580 [Parasponia andersonii]
MAERARTLRFGAVLLLLLLSFAFCGSEARGSNAIKWAGSPWGATGLRTIKHSGPSPGGPGHRSRSNGRLLRVPIKESVTRSEGEGH